MNKSILLNVAAIAILGCGSPPAPPLTLGAVSSLTGGLGTVDPLNALLLAAEEINQNGGVLGKQIALEYRDDQTNPTRAVEVANELMDLGVPVIFGTTASPMTLAMASVTVPREVLVMSGSSTTPSITTYADNGYLFRTCPSDALQGKLMARRAKARSFTKAAVIHLPGAYGNGLANQFVSEFQAGGGTISAKIEYIPQQMSYSTLLDQIYADNPQTIVLVGLVVDATLILQDYLSRYSAKGTFWYFSDSITGEVLVTAMGGASNFTFQHEGVAPGNPQTPHNLAYRAKMVEKYQATPLALAGGYYDAMMVTALAIEAAGDATSAAIKAALPLVSKGGTKYNRLDLAALLTEVRAGGDVDYEGVSGPIDFDDNGDVAGGYDVWAIQGGQYTLIGQDVQL